MSLTTRNVIDYNSRNPQPDDFVTFVPWACNQQQMETAVEITKVHQHEYVSVAISDRSKAKNKGRVKTMQSQADFVSDDISESFRPLVMAKSDRVVKLITVYDSLDNIVQLKMADNKQIPLILMKIVGLIIQFQIHLTSVIINKGLDKYTMHELHKMLPLTHITELCLDDTYLGEANYYILLEKPNHLTRLSLARCNLDDIGIKEIALQLSYPKPASKTLHVLNLSTNRISDAGAKYLAHALRSNRQLNYINLAGNMVTDDGASSIFDSLQEFALTPEELLNTKSRHMEYLLKRKALIEQIVKELKAADFGKKALKKKSTKIIQIGSKKPKGLETDGSLPEGKEFGLSLHNVDSMFYEKAVSLAETTMGDYEDPYNSEDTYMLHGEVHCSGNSSLRYLNLAYNTLSYLSVKKLLQILMYQIVLKPKGLINVIIEGNYLPAHCSELLEIDDLLDTSLMMQARTGSKKKYQSKISTKG